MQSLGLVPAPFTGFPIDIRHWPVEVVHRHSTHEFFLAETGRCLQMTRRGVVENAAGELFFFPAGQDHNSNNLPGRVCRALVVNFEVGLFGAGDEGDAETREVIGWLRERALAGDNRVPLSAGGARAAGRAFAAVVDECLARRPGSRAAMKLRLQELLIAVLRDERVLPELGARFRPGDAPARLAAVLAHVERRFAEPIAVARMAALAGLSRSHFHAVFRRETGRTLVEHVAETRVRAAERMLADTAMPIIDVAAACGFPTLSRFYHVFRALRRTTPKAAREAARAARA